MRPFDPSPGDYEWVVKTFPAVGSLETLAQNFDEQAEADRSDIVEVLETKFGMAPQTRPQRRKFMEDYGKAFTNVIFAVSALASREETDEARVARCVEVATPYYADGPNAEHGPYVLGRDAARHARFRHDLREQALDTEGRLQGFLQQGPEAEYRMLEVFADAGVRDWSQADLTTPSESLSFLVAEATQEQRVDNPVLGLVDKLKQGSYDRFVARRLIDFAANHPNWEDSRVARISELVAFHARIVPDMPEPDRITQLTETTEAWPGDVRTAFKLGKQALGEVAISSVQFAEKTLDKLGLNRPTDSNEALEEAIAKLAQLEQRNQVVLPGQQSTRAQVMRAKADFKRARRQRQSEALPPSLDSDEAVIQEPKEVIFMDASGNRYGIGSEEFDKAVIGEYFNNGVRPEELEKDVSTIIDYLRGIDFSRTVRGVEKCKWQMDTANGKRKTFELKVSEAPGLSTQTDQAKKIRVFFSMPEKGSNEVLVHAIRDKDDVAKFENGNKLGRARSGRRK